MNKQIKRAGVVLVACLALALYFALSEESVFSLHYLQELARSRFIFAAVLYMIALLTVAALNLPGSGPLSIGSGAIFGFAWGLALTGVGLIVGAVISMLMARSFLHEWAEKRFSKTLAKINRGVERDGDLYLFVLRLLPGVPYFIVNPVFGLTRMPLWRFTWVSVLGILPVTAVYVNAGAGIGRIEKLSFSEVLTPQVLLSFALLICFPLLVKFALRHWRKQDSSALIDEAD
jgi:uncharacterized membrane protein YdjX (TVP38/TMEM64 family)